MIAGRGLARLESSGTKRFYMSIEHKQVQDQRCLKNQLSIFKSPNPQGLKSKHRSILPLISLTLSLLKLDTPQTLGPRQQP